MSVKTCLQKCAWFGNLAIGIVAGIALIIGVRSLFGSDKWTGWIAVGLVDLYIAVALFFAAYLSDHKSTKSGSEEIYADRSGVVSGRVIGMKKIFHNCLPQDKALGLIAIVVLTAAMIMGFAGLYMRDDMFMESSIPTDANGIRRPNGGKNAMAEGTPDTSPTHKDRLDALYISFQTLGFSDFTPKSTYCTKVVMAELASGMLLLLGAFSLLLSRVSDY